MDSAARIPTIYGDLCVTDPEVDLISRSLKLHGEWAFAEALLLAPLLRPTDVFWDVGAYLGTFGLGLSRLARPARLLTVEANAEVLPLLTRNLKANAPCPAEVVHAAVALSEGPMRLARNAAGNVGATGYAAAPGSGGDTVPGRTLRGLRNEFGDYDVLKLDIEGLEADALLGDAVYLKEKRPVIWAECNEDQGSLRLLAVLRQLGYEPLYIGFPAFRKVNFRGNPERIYPLAYEAALLAAPPERLAAFDAAASGEECVVRKVATQVDLRLALFDTPRWATAEWAGMSRPELIARLGRLTRGHKPGAFLPGDEAPQTE